jgi:protein-tyrosine kinase
MKLRKALEKAKRERGDQSRTLTALRSIAEDKVVGNGWSPPVYSQSRAVELNKETLMKNRCVCIEPDAIELDSYKVLRTKIMQATRGKGWRTVMITSVQPGEGKTLTTVNLALTFAKAYNQTVLLVDCD